MSIIHVGNCYLYLILIYTIVLWVCSSVSQAQQPKPRGLFGPVRGLPKRDPKISIIVYCGLNKGFPIFPIDGNYRFVTKVACKLTGNSLIESPALPCVLDPDL